MEKISIIIPAYNLEGYIDKCLDSLLAQSFEDYAVYIIDDGSTDQTGEIIDRYAGKDSRIHAFHKKNAGVSAARNDMIPFAKGEYILFFDGDDHVDPDALRLLWEFATSKNADMVLYGYVFEKLNGERESHPPVFDRAVYEKKEEKNEIVSEIIPHFIGVSFEDISRWLEGDANALKKENNGLWLSMIRRRVIEDNHIRFDTRLKVGEDTCFKTECLSCSGRVAVLNRCLYFLVERESSAIYVYEQDPEKVRRGKTRLLGARRALTERIRKKRGDDIEPYWQGTVVMSVFQLAFLYAGHTDGNRSEQYTHWMAYVKQKETQRAISAMPSFGIRNVKCIPFFLLKKKWYAGLYMAVEFLSKAGYTFQR